MNNETSKHRESGNPLSRYVDTYMVSNCTIQLYQVPVYHMLKFVGEYSKAWSILEFLILISTSSCKMLKN